MAPALFSATPGQGFEWTMNSTKVIEGINFYYFFCSKDGSETRSVLIVQDCEYLISKQKKLPIRQRQLEVLAEFANINK